MLIETFEDFEKYIAGKTPDDFEKLELDIDKKTLMPMIRVSSFNNEIYEYSIELAANYRFKVSGKFEPLIKTTLINQDKITANDIQALY